MDFTTELTTFESTVHQVIYAAARGLAPLEVTLPSVPEELREACTALHDFMVDMHSDMYDHPEAYALPVLALEAYCGGRTVNAMKQKAPSKTKGVLAQTRNVVQGYIGLLYWLGRLGTVREGGLAVSGEDLAVIGPRVSTSTSPIALEVRLKALERVGLLQVEGGFASGRYPQMFAALHAMAQRADKQSGFPYFAFGTADFRALGPKYKPAPEDYFWPLITAQREDALALHAFALAKGLKPTIQTFWKVDYKYRATQVMCIGSEWDFERMLDIRIVGTYAWDDPELINGRLRREPEQFQRTVLRNVWRCDACSTTHLAAFVTILGRRQRVCGGGMIGFRFRNPGTEEMAVLRRLVELRVEILEELHATGKARKG